MAEAVHALRRSVSFLELLALCVEKELGDARHPRQCVRLCRLEVRPQFAHECGRVLLEEGEEASVHVLAAGVGPFS